LFALPDAVAQPHMRSADKMARIHLSRSLPRLFAILLLLTAMPGQAARWSRAGFFPQSLELPGIPAAVLPADVDGDGRDDLVVLVAYTGWDTVTESERVHFDDIEGLVEVMNIVTGLIDRRQLLVYPGSADGQGFSPPWPALDLDTSVHALAGGHPAAPLLAITDEGVAAIVLTATADGPQLAMKPLLETESSLSGAGSFYSDLNFLTDLNDDGIGDLLLPTDSGWTIHAGTPAGFAPQPAARLTRPAMPEPDPDEDEDGNEENPDHGDGDGDEDEDEDAERDRAPRRPRVEIPAGQDVNADGHIDLVLRASGSRGPLVYRNLGHLGFAPAIELELPETDAAHPEIVFLGDVNGDGHSELVSRDELELDDDAGWREEVREAKEPRFQYRLHPVSPELEVAGDSIVEFPAVGYTFSNEEQEDDDDDFQIRLPGGFQDLDGDGRLDLVSITLDFSILPMVFQVLVTGRISLRMDFHPWCQKEDGRFVEVPNLDLSGKFKVDLRNAQIRHLSQFAGDFNGDGRADFIQLGRGRKVAIQQGGPGCRYPVSPDRRLRLRSEPRHLGLVRILDLDGDGLSDLYVVDPQRAPANGASIPARLDLYLSESSPTR